MTFRKVINGIHLWLGLLSGLVVFIVSITGAAYVFRREIEAASIPQHHYVEKQNKPFAPLSAWLHSADVAFKPYQVRAERTLMWKTAPGSVVVVSSMYTKDKVDHYINTYLNPYTANVVEVSEGEQSFGIDFLNYARAIHVDLMLGEVGSYIVRYGTLVYFIMLISGIILWWPKNKAGLRQRYKFRWKDATRWKRKNYDLHNVFGFYICWIVIFMVISGLVMSFSWFSDGLYFVLSGKTPISAPEQKVVEAHATTNSSQLELAFDRLKRLAANEHKTPESFYISYPSDTSGTIYTNYGYNPKGIVDEDYQEYTFGRVSLKVIGSTAERNNAGDWFMAHNTQIHFGSVFGMGSKLIVFFACLLSASLPITGFLIWWGRRIHGGRGFGGRKKAAKGKTKLTPRKPAVRHEV